MIAIYIRVSTEEQATKGYSLDNQTDECIRKAGTNEVLKYIDDGFSGELLERPGLDKMRRDMRKGMIETIICYDPDRLSRKLMNQLIIDDEIRKMGIKLVFVNGEYANTPEGQLFFSMRGAISEFEKAKIKERTSSGRRSKAKKGKVVKDNKLYGYTFEKDTYVINEAEAKVVKMIFDYYTNPESPFKGINGIAKHLTDIGVPTKLNAKMWHRQVVRQILMNEAYTGVYYQNKYDTEGLYVKKQSGTKESYKIRPEEEWIKATIPRIIDDEQFEYAKELLNQGRRRFANTSQHPYLLSGLVRCGKCGETMPGRRKLSHGKDYFIYSGRKNVAGTKSSCKREMSENKLNNIVWTHLIELFNNPEKLNDYQDEQQDNFLHNEIEIIEKEIEKTKKGRKRLIGLISLTDEDEMDLEEIKDEIRTLQQKENELKKQYTLIMEQLKGNEEKSPNEDIFRKAIDLYINRKEKEFSFEDKQSIIRLIVKEVLVFDKDTVEIHLF